MCTVTCVDVWMVLFSLIAQVVLFIAAHILPVAVNNPFGVITSNSPGPWIDAVGILGLFIDLPFLFAALSVLLVWKGFILGVKVWQQLVSLLPW